MRRGIFMITLVFLLLTLSHEGMASSNTATPIQHIIIIMQENHSFDNYFGTYPTANGTLVDETTSRLQRVDGIPSHSCLSYLDSCISPHLTTSQDPSNPFEGQLTYEMDYSNNGTGFPTYSGPQSMVYFDYHSIAAYWDYAEEYGLADNYFAPVLSTTTPNRLLLLSGDTPVSANYGPPPYIPYSETVMRQLDDSGLSWKYYDFLSSYGGASNVYPLNYTSDMPPSAIRNVGNVDDLFQELARGSGLPSVSFVNSLGKSELTEHPPFSPTMGELWVLSIVNEVMKSVYWPTAVIFITWDEGGGYYDHVVPPRNFTLSHGFSQPLVGFGQRVPLLVISPYSREGFVSHDLLSHLSLLHFVEHNWNLPPLNMLVNQSNLPLGFFDFYQAPRPPLILSSSTPYPLPRQGQSSGLLIAPEIQYGLFLAAVTVVLVSLMRRARPFPQNRGDRDPEQNGEGSRKNRYRPRWKFASG